MSVVCSYERGLYAAGEQALLMHDGLYHPEPRKVIVGLHGHTGDYSANGPAFGGYFFEPVRALVEAGFVVYSIDAGGPATFANPSSMTAVGAAVDRMRSAYSVSKVALYGASMGAAIALNVAKRTPTKVNGLLLFSGLTDLEYAHSPGYSAPYSLISGAAPGAYNSQCNTAFGTNDAGWTAASAGYRMSNEYATWRGLNIPIRLFHHADDTTCPPGMADAFVAGVNDPLVTIRSPKPTGGHVNPLPFQGPNKDYPEFLSFFQSLAWS